ncbi:GH25 family lysozyme [Lactovum odontotermitis]
MKLKKILICSSFALGFILIGNQLTQADSESNSGRQVEVVQPGDEAARVNTPHETGINIPMGYFALYGNQENPTSEAQVESQQVQKNIDGVTPAAIGSSNAAPASRQRMALASSPDNLNASDSSLPRHDAVDVASWQKWMTQADFNILKANGVKSVVVKISEGTWYKNPEAKRQIQMAKAAGLAVSVYHYLDLADGDTNSQAQANSLAAAEANYFASVAAELGISTGVSMIADCENPSVPASISWTQAMQSFTQTLNARGYGNVKYYTSLSWVQNGHLNPSVLGEKRMWIAQYLFGKPSASNLQHTQYGAWQFSSLMYFNGMSAANPVDVSIDYVGLFNGDVSTGSGTAAVYRLYNPNSGEHFYTEDSNEKDYLANIGWNYEGMGWVAPKDGAPVYRVYNPNAGDHFYTLNANEKDNLVSLGWRYEGVSFYSGGSGTVYRAYNPNAKAGSHNYTLDQNEQNSLIRVGWRDEGIAWYSIR